MKKRLILILSAIFSVFILLFALTGCSNNVGNTDVSKANFVAGTTPYETLEEFVLTYPDRTSTQSYGLDKAKEAAQWIAGKFAEFGYETSYNINSENEGLDIFTYQNNVTNKSETAYNVVFKKESSSNKKVVIGAHYDNIYDISYNGVKFYTDGTYNNGVGIATLIETARVLKDKDLPFDLEFVAFGAEEFGWLGSDRYLNNQTDKENIILMINFDRNAIGDYVYMYSSEAKTEHNKFFYDVVNENNLCIAELPSYRSPSLNGVPSNSYVSNELNWSDSDKFLAEGINIINFSSMNFLPSGVVESEGKQNIAYTRDDNLTYVESRLGGRDSAKAIIDKQINSAISSIVYAFEKENFVDVMSASKANNGMDTFANSTIILLITYGIIALLIIILLVLYFTLGVKTKSHDVYINTPYGRINKTTGKLENAMPQDKSVGGNIGSVFGEEFDPKNKENIDGEIGKNKDKTNDIFGDF